MTLKHLTPRVDFQRQLNGYGLTTAQILYRRPDHPWLLQTYVWQNYDLFPKFPELKRFLTFWMQKLDGPLHSVGRAQQADQARRAQSHQRRIPAALAITLPQARVTSRGVKRARTINPCGTSSVFGGGSEKPSSAQRAATRS